MLPKQQSNKGTASGFNVCCELLSSNQIGMKSLKASGFRPVVVFSHRQKLCSATFAARRM